MLSLLLLSCAKEATPEQQAAERLDEARTLLANGNAQAAKDTILSMRRQFPTAIAVRRQAILTLDSVELALAIEEQDSLRTMFYIRKIQHDEANQ